MPLGRRVRARCHAGIQYGAARRDTAVADSMEGRIRLHAAAVFRFFRLFGYGGGPVAPLWHTTAVQLCLALSGNEYHRFLATLAHDAVALPARLPLHPLRRQPLWQDAALCQSDADDAVRRIMARGQLDICGVGRSAWAVSDRKPWLAGGETVRPARVPA